MAPDINESFGTFTVVTPSTKENKAANSDIKADTIRFGLKAIKNVGEHIVDELIRERKAHGPFTDIFDLLARVTDKDLNKKSLESLIKSGALDSFGERGFMLANSDKFLSFNKEEAKNKNSLQGSLFGGMLDEKLSRPTLQESAPATQSEKLVWEKELLGLYVSEHPFNLFKSYLAGYAQVLLSLANFKGQERVITAGIISNIKKIITRKGESMIFVKLEDSLSSVELLIFPRLYKESIELWEEGRAIILAGKVSEKDQDIKFLVDKAAILELSNPIRSIDDFKKLMMASPLPSRRPYQAGASYGNSSSVKVKSSASSPKNNDNLDAAYNKSDNNSALVKSSTDRPLLLSLAENFLDSSLVIIKDIFAVHSGDDEVYFRILEGDKYKVVKTAFRIANNKELRSEL